MTALTATLALLLSDGPTVRRQEQTQSGPTQSGPVPTRDQADQDSPAAVDSASRTIGRLNVTRASRAAVKDLLNDSPLPIEIVYFDAAGQVQTLGDTAEQKMIDQKVAVDETPHKQQQQQQQVLKLAGETSRRTSSVSTKMSIAGNVDVGSAAPRGSNLPARVIDEEQDR